MTAGAQPLVDRRDQVSCLVADRELVSPGDGAGPPALDCVTFSVVDLVEMRRPAAAGAEVLADAGNERNLQQCVNQSTWDPMPVQRRICERMLALIEPVAWVHAATDTASCPLQWRDLAGPATAPCSWTARHHDEAGTGRMSRPHRYLFYGQQSREPSAWHAPIGDQGMEKKALISARTWSGASWTR